MLTCEEISLKLGISARAVRKRNLAKYIVSTASFGGRPKIFYSDDVLQEFNIFPENQQIQIAPTQQFIQNSSKIKVPEYQMNEKQQRKRAKNTSAGKSRVIAPELESKIKTLTLTYYLQQARKKNIRYCVELACKDLWSLISKETEKDLESFAWYFYNKRVKNKSSQYVGYAHTESWYTLWEQKHDVNKYNTSLPTNRWHYLELFKDAGLIAKGFGAGSLWVCDGTQFNAWIDDNGKAKTMSYLCIIDVLTGMPLYEDFMQNGESICDVSRILWECAQIHGKPKFGIILDNGSAFRSPAVKNLIRSWYHKYELEDFKNNNFRKTLFGGQTEPYIFPLAKIPRYPFKAYIERNFDKQDLFVAEEMALSYIGTRDSRKTSNELGSTPNKGVAARVPKGKAFELFLTWIYTDLIHRNEAKLSFLKREGLSSSVAECWRYFGGELYLGDGFENIQIAAKQIKIYNENKEFSENAKYFAEYGMCGNIKKIKANNGHLTLIHNKVQYNFISEFLDISLINRKVSVVLRENENEALIFLEYDPNRADARTPDKDSIYFVGIAQNAVINSVESLENVKQNTTKVRNIVNKNIKDFSENLAGKIKVKNRLLGLKDLEKENPVYEIQGESQYLLEDAENDEFNIDSLLNF